MSKIVIIQESAQWSGDIADQIPLQVPDNVDIKKAEAEWFAAGGGSAADFASYLKSLGAQDADVCFHEIGYL